MPLSPAPLTVPHFPSSPQLGPEEIGYAPPDFATLALPQEWLPAYKWAVNNQVLEELIAIINVTQLQDSPVAFGTVASFLAHDNAISLLTEWQEFEPAAVPLHRFSLAIIRNPEILRKYTPLTIAKSASSEFRTETKQKYLTALLAEHPASTSPEETEWLNTMKLWLLVHAMDRAKLGNVQDILIRSVSTQLRLACKSAGNWRNIFQQLRSQSHDFDGISAGIRRRAQALQEKNQKNPLSGTERPLIKAILEIDDGKEARDPKTLQNVKLISFAWPRNDAVRPHAPTEEIEQYGDESENKSNKWIQSPQADDGGFTESETDQTQSYTHQAIQGNGLLLQCIEDLQYLSYSWSHLNPTEVALLEKWIAQGWNSNQPAIQYLTLITWTALHLGRSLKRTLSIALSAEFKSEWCFNPGQFEFCRLPPRRTPGWHPTSNQEAEWVSQSSPRQAISVPVEARDFIEKRLRNMRSAPLTLGDLWDSEWGEAPEKVFRKEIASILPRVTGGMLGSHLPQIAFKKSGDSTFARLLGSHPQTSLPGACAYASWSSREIAPYLQLPEDQASHDDNAMGSRLDPIESLLCAAIKGATARVEQLRIQDDVVSYHNAYVAYLVVAIIAAAAARPNRDPFEKLAHFDFDEAFVYISDKVSGSLRQGRLVPLPVEICTMLREDYAAHLRTLGNIFPHLATPIQELLSGNVSAPLPYFFLLTDDGKDWKSVSETEIAKLGLFDWPLPLNHFRHRLAKRLRGHGADPEVIDALMGHAEAGTATHGDFSLRVWKKDIEGIRPAIEAIYSSLGFVRIKPVHSVSTTSSSGKLSPIPSRLFGAALREKERRASLRESIEDANSQIENFIGNRSLSELSEEEVDALSRKLMFKSDGMPHPRGQIKYRILIKLIEREWRANGKRVKVSKRYQAIPEDTSPFTEHAPRALAKYQRLKEVCASISSADCRKRPYGDAAVVGSFLLCVENQITNLGLLNDVLHGRNFRLVSADAKLYLEHSKVLPKERIDCPVQRYRISERTGRCLDRVLSSKKTIAGNAPRGLFEFAQILGLENSATSSSMLAAITKIIDQVNVMTMPGIVSGYLAGRVESYSLPWRDWARLELGYPISTPTSQNTKVDTAAQETLLSVSAAAHFPHPAHVETNVMLEAARKLLENISAIIRSSDSSDRGYSIEARKKTARQIQDLIELHAPNVSSTIQLLCRWICTLLFRKNRGHYIRTRSISRYLSALQYGFIESGYELDILIAESEEITELYTQILEARKVEDLQYVGERLGDFHRWARSEYFIEDPDWGELPEMATTLRVSPSFISETEYLDALRLLDNSNREKDTAQVAQEILLLSYRFGLRGNEAAGLLRSDMQLDEESIVAFIQNNKHRKLKTATSRRQVPLLFRLTEEELTIFQGLLTRHEVRHGDNMSMPLFGAEEISEQQINQAKRLAIEALKLATGNPMSNLHHARHSFANLIWNALTSDNHLGQFIQPSTIPDIEYKLLGRTGETRRKIWALSRLLGHGRRETTARNYLHLLSDFCDQHVGIADTCNPETLMNVITLEKFDRLAKLDTSLLTTLEKETANPTYGNILRLMRLASRGQSISDAAEALNLSQKVGGQLHELLDLIGGKIKLSQSKLSSSDVSMPPHVRLLRRIKESTWNRLIEHADVLENKRNDHAITPRGIHDIANMIGASRQILIWEESQFGLLSSFIEFTRLQSEDYRIIRTNRTNHHLDKLLSDFNFQYILEKAQPTGHRIQVDKASFGDGKFIVAERCAFTINENDHQRIRQSTDLLVTFCAHTISLFGTPN